MKESFWAVMVFGLGITSIFLIYYFQTVTNTSEHNYELLRETTEAAMFDSLDLAAYKYDSTIRIDQERFAASFLRRFAEDATMSHEYNIRFYDIHEEPPKVSIKVDTFEQRTHFVVGSNVYYMTLSNRIDAILETKY